MRIEKVKVANFRNIRNQEFEIKGNVAFTGTNRLGKTNMLNAIMWCICGVDLENKSCDLLNVPFDLLDCDNECAVDVEVKLDVGSIRRIIVYKNGSCRQSVFINNIPYETLKDAELKIDEMLGILKLTLHQSKDFNVRRFLINPLYIIYAKESALREFVISLLDSKDVNKREFEKLNDTIKNKLGGLLEISNFDISSASTLISNLKKGNKKSMDYWLNVIDFLNQYEPENTINIGIAKSNVVKYGNELSKLAEKEVSLDILAKNVSKVLQSVCNCYFKGIKVCLIEKGQGDDVWKERCYPLIPDTEFAVSQGSTSERIIVCSQFLSCLVDTIPELPHLPILFDEFETLDNSSIKAIANRTKSQFITAMVDPNSESKNIVCKVF